MSTHGGGLHDRHVRSRLIVVAALAATMVLALLGGPAGAVDHEPSPPSRASHSLKIAHVPPATATPGEDLPLRIGVASDCGFVFCGTISVRVRYVDAHGRRGTVGEDLFVWPPVQVATLTIPSDAVIAPHVTYRIRVQQDRCKPFARRCSHAIATWPTKGSHTVAVRSSQGSHRYRLPR